MSKYFYILELSRGVSEREALKADICHVFKSVDVSLINSNEVQVYSPLGPKEIDGEFRRLTGKYGPVEIRAGTKLE